MKIKRILNLLTLLLSFTLSMLSASVFAQTFPDSARTESIQNALTPIKTPDVELKQSTLPEEPQPEKETEIESSSLGIAKLQKAVPHEATFHVSSVRLKGSTVFKEKKLTPFLEPYTNTERTLSELKALADKLTRLYQSEGYILSRVIVPAQEVTGGDVVLQAVEGSVQDIHFSGKIPEKGHLIHKYADAIKTSVPLNIKDLERATLLMNDLPGLYVKAVLSPAKDVQKRFDNIVDESTEQSYKLTHTLKAMGLEEHQVDNFIDVVGAVNASKVQRPPVEDLSLILQGMGIPDKERKILVKKAVEAADRNRMKSVTEQTADALVSLSDVNILIQEKKVSGSLALDNHGTKFVGPVQLSGALSLAHDTEGRSETSLGFSVTADTKEMKYGEISHKRQVGTKGTTVEGTYSIARSRPGNTLKDLEFESASDVVGVTVEHPVVRSRSSNLKVRGTLDARSSEVRSFDNRFSKDTTRSVRAGATYDFADSYQGLNLIDVEFSKGLDILGGDDKEVHSRADGQQDYAKVNMQLSRLQRLGKFTNLLASVRGQYAFNPLLASEEFSFGGASQGRGYDPAELSGDHGIGGTLQLSYDIPMCRKCLKDISLYGFYDAGMVWQKGLVTGDKRSFASSAGVGAGMNFTDKLSGKIELAKPLTKSRDNSNSGVKDAVILMRVKGSL